MRSLRFTTPVLIALALTTAVVPLQAASVKHMDLRALVANADRIVRGTVIAKDDTAVAAGGGTLPATRYRIRVAESLKGSVAAGDVIEVRLLAGSKGLAAGPARRGTLLQDLPEFSVGQEYLFLLTRPSAVGLSTTVGLRQGLFELRGRGSEVVAVNGANNTGLMDEPAAAGVTGAPGARAARPAARPASAGPLSYATLAREIRALVTR